MKFEILLSWVCMAASCEREKQAQPKAFVLPEVGVVSIENGWKRTKIGARNHFIGTSWSKGSMECADHHGDGSIDYLRVQEPPGSYHHYVLIDTDHDGFFDKESGSPSHVLLDKKLPVPSLIDE